MWGTFTLMLNYFWLSRILYLCIYNLALWFCLWNCDVITYNSFPCVKVGHEVCKLWNCDMQTYLAGRGKICARSLQIVHCKLNYIYYLHNACKCNGWASVMFFVFLIHFFFEFSDGFGTLPNLHYLHYISANLSTVWCVTAKLGTFKAGHSSQTQLTARIHISLYKVNLRVPSGSVYSGIHQSSATSCDTLPKQFRHHLALLVLQLAGTFTSIIKLLSLNKIQETFYLSSS